MRPAESFLGQPIRSLQTMLRVIAEDRTGYERVIPDGIYGPETTKAVSVFQRNHGLPVTGVADQQTWETIAAHYEPARISRAAAEPLHILLDPGQVIRKGERHPNIWLVQAMLASLADTWESIDSPGLSGILDDATARSLESFQLLSGLPATGHLDKHTWRHLALHYPLAARVWVSMEE